jgi:hypothetical protein
MDPSATSDVIAIQQLLAHYAVSMTKDDVNAAIEVFATDATFSSFGHTRGLDDFVLSTRNGPKAAFITGPAAIVINGDAASGEQPVCIVNQTSHDTLIGWYTDTFRRTEQGWRIQSRSLTFLRRSGARDAGEPTDTVTGERFPDIPHGSDSGHSS